MMKLLFLAMGNVWVLVAYGWEWILPADPPVVLRYGTNRSVSSLPVFCLLSEKMKSCSVQPYIVLRGRQGGVFSAAECTGYEYVL